MIAAACAGALTSPTRNANDVVTCGRGLRQATQLSGGAGRPTSREECSAVLSSHATNGSRPIATIPFDTCAKEVRTYKGGTFYPSIILRDGFSNHRVYCRLHFLLSVFSLECYKCIRMSPYKY